MAERQVFKIEFKVIVINLPKRQERRFQFADPNLVLIDTH